MESTSSNRGLIIGIVVVTVLIFGGLVWAIMSAPSNAPQNQVSGPEAGLSFNDQNNPAIGSIDAKVVVRMFSDFQCPYCRDAEPAVKYAIGKYQDRVRFIWDDFPLLTVHPNARLAANAARCAEDQGKFWEYRDALYTSQADWSGSGQAEEKMVGYATRLGLDQNTFSSCLVGRKNDGKVMDDVNEGNRNHVDSTPTFFVNNRRYHFQTAAEWDQAIAQAFAEMNSTPTNASSSTP